MPRRRRWSYSAGNKPHTVIVYERTAGGSLHARCWDPKLRGGVGGRRRVSLGHKDRERAISYAHEQAVKLLRAESELTKERMTLARVFSVYRQLRSPQKARRTQGDDARRVEMWTRVLGAKKDPSRISLGEWERFIDARSSGAIDARGRPVPEGKRKSVRTRAIEADLKLLHAVFCWASDKGDHHLIAENPVHGYPIPTEKNVRRPVATADRYEAIRAVTDEVMMEVRWHGRREVVRSHLSEIFDLANDTGRRIGAIRQLRYADLKLNVGRHGYIHWPADTDKQGNEYTTPIGPLARAALDRALGDRPGIGNACIFPSPKDPAVPVPCHLCDKWLRKAERLAGVEPLEQGLWHPYRRRFATELWDQPDRVVTKLGGWKDARTLELYQQPGEDAMLQALEGRKQLREMAQGG